MNSKKLTFVLALIIVGLGIFYWQGKEAVAPQNDDKEVWEMQKDEFLPAVSNDGEVKFHQATTTSSSTAIVVDQTDNNALATSGEAIAPLAVVTPPDGQNFVIYHNKAIGYTVARPDKWYWQHFNSAELQEIAPQVKDYLILDRNPLPGFGSEYLGRIIIEVTEEGAISFDHLSSFEKRSVMVAGQEAARYAKLGKINNWVEYHFKKGSLAFRIIYYNLEDSDLDLAIFEHFVSSFKLN